MLPVQVRFPVVPASVIVHRVLGEPSASLIVSVPLLPAVASVTTGLVFDSTSGAAPDRVMLLPVEAPRPVTLLSVEISFMVAVVVPVILISVPLAKSAVIFWNVGAAAPPEVKT